nr:hypothetical protein [Bacillus sp. TH13]
MGFRLPLSRGGNYVNRLRFKNVVARDRLLYHVEELGVECNKRSMDDMYEKLSEVNLPLVKSVYKEYEFAGKTSLNIFEILDFPSNLNNKKAFLNHVKKKLGINTNILNVHLRPAINEQPKVNYIEEFENGYRIEWVSGTYKESTNGYEIINRLDTKYVTTIVRLGSPVFIEIRAGYTFALSYLKLFKSFLSESELPVEFQHIPLTKVTEAEAILIAETLKAGLLEGEHLGSNGIGKYAVSADRDTSDLRKLPEYQSNFVGKRYLAQTLNVPYRDEDTGYVTSIKFKISMNGGFEFKTKVNEKIIRRIFDVFAEVRYKKVASGE